MSFQLKERRFPTLKVPRAKWLQSPAKVPLRKETTGRVSGSFEEGRRRQEPQVRGKPTGLASPAHDTKGFTGLVLLRVDDSLILGQGLTNRILAGRSELACNAMLERRGREPSSSQIQSFTAQNFSSSGLTSTPPKQPGLICPGVVAMSQDAETSQVLAQIPCLSSRRPVSDHASRNR